MREFSDFEKTKIRYLVNSKNPSISEFITENILENRLLAIDSERQELILFCSHEDRFAVNDFFEIISLLDYLEKNRFLFIHEIDENIKNSFLSKNWRLDSQTKQLLDSNENQVPAGNMNRIPTNVFDLMIRYNKSFYHVGTELRMLIENDFETNESRQLKEVKLQTELSQTQLIEANKQTKYSKFAFYVSLLALCISIVLPFFIENTMKINSEQFDLLYQKSRQDNNGSNLNITNGFNQIRTDTVLKKDTIKVQTPNKAL